MKAIRKSVLFLIMLAMATPLLAQQKTTVKEIWEDYINEAFPVKYYDVKPNIADFAVDFCQAHRGMPLTDELENFLSVDGYKNADVEKYICDLKAGFVRLLFKDDVREIEACYWNLPSGKKRIAFMLYDT